MYGHRLARELEAWWTEHGGNHSDPKWRAFIEDYRSLLPAKFEELTSEHKNLNAQGQKCFGMSKAGGCTRSATIKALGYEPEPFDGSSLFTFFIGHSLEVVALACLRACGYEVGDGQARCAIEPMMNSASDGLMTIDGKPTILSVKTTGYKKSGMERGKPVRRGFPELPFEGVRKSQPSWWAQAQGEMHATGIKQTLVLVLAKDIVKAMSADPYLMGPKGNGSLTFYAEMIPYDRAFCREHLLPVWNLAWDAKENGHAGPAYFLNGGRAFNGENQYVELEVASDKWKPNADRTGTFNPCAYCDVVQHCKVLA